MVQAVNDVVVKGIRRNMYFELFGAGGHVVMESCSGGHLFFIQDHVKVKGRLLQWFEGRGGSDAAGVDIESFSR